MCMRVFHDDLLSAGVCHSCHNSMIAHYPKICNRYLGKCHGFCSPEQKPCLPQAAPRDSLRYRYVTLFRIKCHAETLENQRFAGFCDSVTVFFTPPYIHVYIILLLYYCTGSIKKVSHCHTSRESPVFSMLLSVTLFNKICRFSVTKVSRLSLPKYPLKCTDER